MADSSSNTPFINKSTAMDAYTESKNWLRPYFEPLDEFERIARNKPSSKIDPSLPKITDGTMAAIIQETPKRVIQQTPTGLLDSKTNPEYAKLADLVLREDIIPAYNRQGNMLQKSWNMVGKSLTWGRATSYTFYTSTNGNFHTDFVIPYAKDILTEKGKVFAADSNVRFMRSWYQKRDIQAILNQETKLEKKDKHYKSDWDLTSLAKLIEGGASAKPVEQMTAAEREKGGDNGGYEIIHAFQNGKDAEFYSFSPQFEDGKPLRAKVNKDPRGLMPFDDLYCNIDLSNPLGRGQVELSGGVQNLIDQQMQMFQFMSTLEMAPPLKVYGNIDKTKLKMRPNAIWDMGAGQQNDVKPYELSNFSLQNFGNNYGLLKSQILGLNSSQDHSVSSDSGNPTQSKTSAGVNAQESRLGVSDNYLRKQFEDWFEDQSETSVNIHFAEMNGKVTKQLKADDIKEIRDSAAAKYMDEQGKLTIPYKDISNVSFSFQVDGSSSEIKEDNDNVEKLTEVLKVMQAVPDPNIQQKLPQIIKLIIDEIGAEGTDDLFPELKDTDPNGQPLQGQQQAPQQPQITPEQIQQLVMQTVQQAMDQQKNQPKTIAESMRWTSADFTANELAQLKQEAGIQPDVNQPTPAQLTNQTDNMLKVDKHAHDTNLAIANHGQTIAQADQQNQLSQQQMAQQDKQAQMQAQQSAQSSSSPAASQSQSQPSSSQPQPDQAQQAQFDASLSPEEQQLVEALLQRGFNEADVEQAVVMMRQGMPLEQIIPTIGQKYA